MTAAKKEKPGAVDLLIGWSIGPPIALVALVYGVVAGPLWTLAYIVPIIGLCLWLGYGTARVRAGTRAMRREHEERMAAHNVRMQRFLSGLS